MNTVLLSILVAAHLTVAADRVFDLFTKSRRENKAQWMVLILLVPVIGVMRYNATMRRRKYMR